MSTSCAIGYKTCQHFYHCHVSYHELLIAYAKLVAFYVKLNEMEVSFSISPSDFGGEL